MSQRTGTVIYYKMGEAGIPIPIDVTRARMKELLLHLLQARDSEGVCEALGWYRMDMAYEEAVASGLVGIA